MTSEIYIIPDLNIKIKKNNNYEFYIDKHIFEVDKGMFIEGSALSRIDTKYNKFLFKINFENLKATIYCNTDYITKKNYRDILEEPKVKFKSEDKNDICYISERNTKYNDFIGNVYLIKFDHQIEKEIKCIIEKTQDENEIENDIKEYLKEINIDKKQNKNYIESNENNIKNEGLFQQYIEDIE